MLVFSILGFIMFSTGKMHGRRAFWQTGTQVKSEWVRRLGLVMIVIDLTQIFIFWVLLQSAFAMHWDTLRDGIMDHFQILCLAPLISNVLIYFLAGFLSKYEKDE